MAFGPRSRLRDPPGPSPERSVCQPGEFYLRTTIIKYGSLLWRRLRSVATGWDEPEPASPSGGSPMQSKLVVALLALGMLTGIFLAAPPARGLAQVALDPPKYHPVYYVPGEQLQFTLTIGGPDPRVYDVLVVWDDGNPSNRKNWSGNQFNDVTLSSSSLVLTFGILPLTAAPPMKDGDWYWVEVHDDQWIETNGTGVGRITWDSAQFMIRTWTLNVEYDRWAYLPGDAVNITWSANMIKDGSLAPSGYDGPLFGNATFGQPW